MQDITTDELKERLDNGESIVLIDVREPYEFEEFNIGGKLIPLATLPEHIAELEAYKDKELVLLCRSGNRSGTAKRYLEDLGFTGARNMTGGMLDWMMKFGMH